MGMCSAPRPLRVRGCSNMSRARRGPVCDPTFKWDSPVMDTFLTHFEYWCARWIDEHEFESWSDYQ